MTRLYRITLEMHTEIPIDLSIWSGLWTRTAFLGLLETAQPELWQQVTDGSVKPFTASPLWEPAKWRPIHQLSPGQAVRFQLTSLSTALSDWLQTYFPLNEEIPFSDELPCFVKCIQIEEITAEALLKKYTLNESRSISIFKLRFISPVIFRHRKMEMPFPMPEWVFGSLADRWNQLCDIKIHPDLRKFASECLRVSHYQMKSEFVNLKDAGYSSASGGVGYVEYRAWRGDEYWKRLIWMLTVFAPYAGVGARTSLGFGCVE
jgi:CRISPR-associated endoribonuclease Cas6